MVEMLFTIGHSTRDGSVFLALLQRYAVDTLVDVRTLPRSRRYPQFNKEAMPGDLAAVGISYEHLPGLGGLRRPRADSPNGGWRNSSFRGFADYMQTSEFSVNLTALLELAEARRVAIMCSEAVPWRCHRSLIADALLASGVAVEHILSPSRAQPHALTPWARVEGQNITYPPPADIQVVTDSTG